MSDQDRIAVLEKAIAELQAQLDALKPKAEPEPFKPQPHRQIDWTANFTLPRSAIEAMVRAVPDGLVRSVVGDNFAKNVEPAKPAETKTIPSERGWRDQVPLGPPEGQRWVEQQLDVAAALDKRELEKKLSGK